MNVTHSKFPLKPLHDNEQWLVFDIESDGLLFEATQIFCICTEDVHTGAVQSYGPDRIDEALVALSQADVLIGHNSIFYDLPVLERLCDLEFKGRAIDTLVCSRVIWPKEVLWDQDEASAVNIPAKLKGSHSLKAWGYRTGENKLEFKDFSEYSEEMMIYCQQDVHATAHLFHHIVSQSYPESALRLEHDLALCISRQIVTGIPFNYSDALDLVEQLTDKKVELEAELKELFPPLEIRTPYIPKVNNKAKGYVKGVPTEKVTYKVFNPGSRQQIIERLKANYGWEPEEYTDKGNAKLDDDVLAALPYPETQTLAEYQLLKKRLGQICDGSNAWIKLVKPDGLMHGDVNTNGTITGRASHSSPNLAQTPAGYSPYGKECRALFEAPQGYVMVGADAKALELRCLAGYLANWDQGAYAHKVIDPETDVHTMHQHLFGVKTRDISKRLLYAMLYGAGALKCGTVIDPLEKNEEKLRAAGRQATQAFMNGLPAFRKLKDQVEYSLADRGYLLGLDGRKLHCRSAFKGLNVLLQSAGGILMKQVIIQMHQHLQRYEYGVDWQQHLWIHDEIQISCRPELVDEITELILISFEEAGEFFNFQCKIEGDARSGPNWSLTH